MDRAARGDARRRGYGEAQVVITQEAREKGIGLTINLVALYHLSQSWHTSPPLCADYTLGDSDAPWPIPGGSG